MFRNALFNDKKEPLQNGDQLPYFQRLRAGSQLNNEVSIHYVSDSKFYKGQVRCSNNSAMGSILILKVSFFNQF